MPNVPKISYFSKIAFFAVTLIYLSGCGKPDPFDWYSYNSRDRQSVSVKVNSAEIIAGSDKKDTIKIKMIWRNDDKEHIKIDDEKFSLSVSGVRLNPEKFETIELDPGQTIETEYDFLVASNFVDKAKYKLALEDYAQMEVVPSRNPSQQ